MTTLLIAIGTMIGYLVAYHTYGRWLARKIFRLDPKASVPSVELNDDRDFVPTDRSVLFGHHFTSIAGTGPIVGPAIAVMWGWLPALLWILIGSVLIGAVHDFGSLVVSMRSRGQTVGDVAGRVLNRRVRLLFLLILFMALTIVLAIFGLVIAAVFKQYPAAIFPCLVQIPIALAIGIWLHRKHVNLLVPSLIALALMYLTLVFGNSGPLGAINQTMASWSVITWVVILLIYSYIASVLPVWTLLQPRDYINSLQLITALGLVVIGLVGGRFLRRSPGGRRRRASSAGDRGADVPVQSGRCAGGDSVPVHHDCLRSLQRLSLPGFLGHLEQTDSLRDGCAVCWLWIDVDRGISGHACRPGVRRGTWDSGR